MEARPRRALVIGIGKYGESELRNAENDAKSMAQQLKVKAGFEVTLLLNPNRKDLTIGLANFKVSIQPNSIVIFYYAGHGMVWNNQHYMMCVDYENYLKRGPADMCKYAGYALGGEGALKEITYSTDHASVIALLDTCRVSVTNDSRLFRGPAAVGNGESTKLTVDTPAGTALLQCYACGHLAAAQDGGEDGNGMYTKHLLQNLFNSNHKSILEALDAANANVVNETQYGQKPELTCTRLAPFSFPLVQGKADKASKFPSFSGDKQPDKHAASNGDKRPFDKYGDQYDDDEYDEYTQPKWYRDEDSSPAAMMAAHMKDLFNSPGYDDHGKGQTKSWTAVASPRDGNQMTVRSVADLVKALRPAASPNEQEAAVKELNKRVKNTGDMAVMMREPGLFRYLVALLPDRNIDTQIAAASLLHSLCDANSEAQAAIGAEPDAVKNMLLLLNDPVPELRAAGGKLIAAIASMHEANTEMILKHPDIFNRLVNLLKERTSDVRTYAAAALSNLLRNSSAQSPAAVEQPKMLQALLAMLDDSGSVARQHAASALKHYVNLMAQGFIGTAHIAREPGLSEKLKKVLQDNDIWHLGASIIAGLLVSTEGNKDLRDELLRDRAVLAALARRLSEPGTRCYSAVAAIAVLPVESDTSISVRITDFDGGVIVRELARLLPSHDRPENIGKGAMQYPELGQMAATALSKIARRGTPIAQSVICAQQGVLFELVKMLSYSDMKVKGTAVNALFSLARDHSENKVKIANEAGAVKGLVDVLSSAQHNTDMLQLLTDTVTALRALANSNNRTKSIIAQYAVEKLVQLLENADDEVRLMAAETLNRLATDHADNKSRIGREPHAFQYLLRLVYLDPSKRVRQAADDAVGELVAENSANMEAAKREAEDAGYVRSHRDPYGRVTSESEDDYSDEYDDDYAKAWPGYAGHGAPAARESGRGRRHRWQSGGGGRSSGLGEVLFYDLFERQHTPRGGCGGPARPQYVLYDPWECSAYGPPLGFFW